MPLDITRTRSGVFRCRVKQRSAVEVVDESLSLLTASDKVRRDSDRQVRIQTDGAQVEENVIKRTQRQPIVWTRIQNS